MKPVAETIFYCTLPCCSAANWLFTCCRTASSGVTTGSEISIYTVTGAKVNNYVYDGNQLNLGHLSPGVYFMQVPGYITQKLIKK